MKVFIITYYNYTDNRSGIPYVCDTLEKAQKMLETIEQNEIKIQLDNGIDRASIYVLKSPLHLEVGIGLDYPYVRYAINEREVK
jgi:hypothetical protein